MQVNFLGGGGGVNASWNGAALGAAPTGSPPVAFELEPLALEKME
jgi:hypothetical protein